MSRRWRRGDRESSCCSHCGSTERGLGSTEGPSRKESTERGLGSTEGPSRKESRSECPCGRKLTISRREEAMNEFMKAAKKTKKSSSATFRGSIDPLVGQMLVNVGRMEFNAEKAKGILDRSFPTVKIPLHKECSYKDLNDKCKQYVWGDSSDADYKYYMADGTGTGIGSSSFHIDLKDSRKTVLPWTLENYLKVSSVKYVSKLRLYSVRKLNPDEEESVRMADSTSEGETEAADPGHVDSDDTSISIPEPAGYFEVLFYVPKRSKYRAITSFRVMNQQNFLYEGDVEDPHTLEIRHVVDKNPDKYHLFQENPLNEGCYLRSITCGEKEFDFVEDCDDDKVIYKSPGGDDLFDTWSGGYCCGSTVLMACVAVNGYHSWASYSWEHDGSILLSESTPLLYCSSKGSYICTVKCQTFQINTEFTVYGVGRRYKVKVVKKNPVVHGEVTVEPPTPSMNTPMIVGEPVREVEIETTEISEVQNAEVRHENAEDRSIATVSSQTVMSREDIEGIQRSCDDPNKLHFLEKIGSGSFGQVFKAIYKGTVVAAKVLVLAGNNKVVQNELNAYKTLHHPNILTFIGIVKEKSRITILTNYVVGKNLNDLLHNTGTKVKLPYARKIHISVQISQALVYMHSHSPPMVHLDLKPENVMIEEATFHVFLADFGLGKMLASCGSAGRTTMQAGTPAFQPPEQLKGEMVGVGSDIYALACIVLEIFGEKQLWEGLAPHTIIFKVAGGSFPSTAHVGAEIRTLIKKCFVPVELRISASSFLQALCNLF